MNFIDLVISRDNATSVDTALQLISVPEADTVVVSSAPAPLLSAATTSVQANTVELGAGEGGDLISNPIQQLGGSMQRWHLSSLDRSSNLARLTHLKIASGLRFSLMPILDEGGDLSENNGFSQTDSTLEAILA